MDVSELQQQLILLCDELRKEQQEKCQAIARAEILELGLETARESEKKMLDSLVSQTGHFMQTKIALEEAKLVIKHLNSTIKTMIDPIEMQKVRNELSKSLEAEGRSKKAMDDLALALKEVTTESNRAKKSYFEARSELERVQAEKERLKSEVDDSFASLREKENGFISSMKISEEEIAYIKKENQRLTESKKAAREEISNLRDIVRQAVKETMIIRNENLQLKDMLSLRDKDFSNITHYYECLKANEAKSSIDTAESCGASDVIECKPIVKFPSENWSARWKLTGESKVLEGSIFDTLSPSTPRNETDRDHDDREMYERDSPKTMKKKRQVLLKFGNMLRMRSFN